MNNALLLSEKIQSGEIKIADVLNEIFSKPDEYNAFISLDKEYAFKRAGEIQKRIDSGDIMSPLSGVPIAIKDNICTADFNTTCASKMLESFRAPYNATAVERINAADMLVIGKTNMDEFAMGSTSETSYFGAVKNPLDITRSAGGSSGGSAAAVSGGFVPLALGSDTGGSVRQPAAYCSCVGLKPTYGAVSRYGLIAYASSLDTIGITGNNVKDVAALYNIISGVDKKDSTSQNCKAVNLYKSDLKGIKLALPYKMISENADSAVLSAFDNAVKRLEELGANVKEIDFTSEALLLPAYYIIASAEASSNLARYDGIRFGYRAQGDSVNDIILNSRSEGFGNEVKKRIMLGSYVLSSGYYDKYYLKALKAKNKICSEMSEIFKGFDSVIMPTSTVIAPLLDESLKNPLTMYKSDLFTVLANLCGLPGVSVPCGKFTGLQLIGKPFGEEDILNIANIFEGAKNEF
ncbi:MAG: Asp-tRNA(Asn)/Glu-tRNA(Gln) amidotransferase subunit GatA [Eubacterium sp.]|nr:Asp-tRNA(Asn)/Glu-tRNA(Gln) amidotransferase subunit GatA [Eubacterium sp.]